MLQVLPAAPQATGFADLGSVLLQAGHDYQAQKQQQRQLQQEQEFRRQENQDRLANELQLQQAQNDAATQREVLMNNMRLSATETERDYQNRLAIMKELKDGGYLNDGDLVGDPASVTAAITKASIKMQNDIQAKRAAGLQGKQNAQATVDRLAAEDAQLSAAHAALLLKESNPLPITPSAEDVQALATQKAREAIAQNPSLKNEVKDFIGAKGAMDPTKEQIAQQVDAARQELGQKLAVQQAEQDRQNKSLETAIASKLADNRAQLAETTKAFGVAPSPNIGLAPAGTALASNSGNLQMASGSPMAPAGSGGGLKQVTLTPGAASNFLNQATSGNGIGTTPPPQGNSGVSPTSVVPSNLQQLPTRGASSASLPLLQAANQRFAQAYIAQNYQAPIDAIQKQLADLDAQEKQTIAVGPTIFQGNPWAAATGVQPQYDADAQAVQLSAIQQKRQLLQKQLQSLQSSMPASNLNPMPPLQPTQSQPTAQSNLVYASPGDDSSPLPNVTLGF